jgi:YVTN family beta-propeller protein
VKVEHTPYAVALAGNLAFVTNQHAGTVSVFDVTTLRIVKTIEVGGYPEGIEADPTGRAVYVACWDADTLERIDTATLEVTGRATVGSGPRAFGRFLR